MSPCGYWRCASLSPSGRAPTSREAAPSRPWPRRLPTRTRKLPRPADAAAEDNAAPAADTSDESSAAENTEGSTSTDATAAEGTPAEGNASPDAHESNEKAAEGAPTTATIMYYENVNYDDGDTEPTRTAGCCWVPTSHRRTRRANDQRMGLRSRHPRAFLLGRLAAESHVD